jgi:hypothetical protein
MPRFVDDAGFGGVGRDDSVEILANRASTTRAFPTDLVDSPDQGNLDEDLVTARALLRIKNSNASRRSTSHRPTEPLKNVPSGPSVARGKDTNVDRDNDHDDSSTSLEIPYTQHKDPDEPRGFRNLNRKKTRKTEPLRPGDIITYNHPAFVAGTLQALRVTQVLRTTPRVTSNSQGCSSADDDDGYYPLVLANGEFLPGETLVQRVQEYRRGELYPLEGGVSRKISHFRMSRRALDASCDHALAGFQRQVAQLQRHMEKSMSELQHQQQCYAESELPQNEDGSQDDPGDSSTNPESIGDQAALNSLEGFESPRNTRTSTEDAGSVSSCSPLVPTRAIVVLNSSKSVTDGASRGRSFKRLKPPASCIDGSSASSSSSSDVLKRHGLSESRSEKLLRFSVPAAIDSASKKAEKHLDAPELAETPETWRLSNRFKRESKVPSTESCSAKKEPRAGGSSSVRLSGEKQHATVGFGPLGCSKKEAAPLKSHLNSEGNSSTREGLPPSRGCRLPSIVEGTVPAKQPHDSWHTRGLESLVDDSDDDSLPHPKFSLCKPKPQDDTTVGSVGGRLRGWSVLSPAERKATAASKSKSPCAQAQKQKIDDDDDLMHSTDDEEKIDFSKVLKQNRKADVSVSRSRDSSRRACGSGFRLEQPRELSKSKKRTIVDQSYKKGVRLELSQGSSSRGGENASDVVSRSSRCSMFRETAVEATDFTCVDSSDEENIPNSVPKPRDDHYEFSSIGSIHTTQSPVKQQSSRRFPYPNHKKEDRRSRQGSHSQHVATSGTTSSKPGPSRRDGASNLGVSSFQLSFVRRSHGRPSLRECED